MILGRLRIDIFDRMNFYILNFF